MTKKFISVFLMALFCFIMVFSASAAYAEDEWLLWDEADLLTSYEESSLSKKLTSLSNAYDAQIIIVTLSSLEGTGIDYMLEYLYDEMDFGYGANKDGVLLLVSMDTRQFRILSNGFAAIAIDSYDIDRISDAIVDSLSSGDYADAFEEFVSQCDYYLDGYINGYPFNFGKTLLICLVIGIIVALIVSAVLKGQLKSVRKQEKANVYVKPGSMNVTLSNDIFLYRNVTRTKKVEKSSGSGRGSSRSTGGRSF